MADQEMEMAVLRKCVWEMADYVVMVYPAIADLTQSCGWAVEQEYLAVQQIV